MIANCLKNAPRTPLLILSILVVGLFISPFIFVEPTLAGGHFINPTVSLVSASQYRVSAGSSIRIPVILTIGDNISDLHLACHYSPTLGISDLEHTSIAPFSTVNSSTSSTTTNIDWDQDVPTVLQTSSTYTLYINIFTMSDHFSMRGSMYCGLHYWIGSQSEYVESPEAAISILPVPDSDQGRMTSTARLSQ